MLQIRTGVFETNSSGTHSFTMCEANDFAKFKSGEMIMVDGKVISFKDAVLNSLKCRWISEEQKATLTKLLEDPENCKEQILENLPEYAYKNYAEYEDRNSEYEQFESSYKTQSGDEIVAFGYYGYNG
jgi:hypothetical protein